ARKGPAWPLRSASWLPAGRSPRRSRTSLRSTVTDAGAATPIRTRPPPAARTVTRMVPAITTSSPGRRDGTSMSSSEAGRYAAVDTNRLVYHRGQKMPARRSSAEDAFEVLPKMRQALLHDLGVLLGLGQDDRALRHRGQVLGEALGAPAGARG